MSRLAEQAAELGGAKEIIGKLPDKIDTYIKSSVVSEYSNLPDGTYSLFGMKDVQSGRKHRNFQQEKVELSGGESQRLAL